ncbi:hypothetical protein KCP71_12935 [Salmonella enterica subsp. enterica]|nr:hypothetical protein KCP71_12935 [Salmonella enterica subsp. enterica]
MWLHWQAWRWLSGNTGIYAHFWGVVEGFSRCCGPSAPLLSRQIRKFQWIATGAGLVAGSRFTTPVKSTAEELNSAAQRGVGLRRRWRKV